MSEAKHTPGPWTASGPSTEPRTGVDALEIGAETPAGHLSVAWVFGFGPGEDVDAAWADARLMAAAPEMLAERDRLRLALTALLTAVERVAMTHRWTDSAGSWESLADLLPEVATLAIVARAARTALGEGT